MGNLTLLKTDTNEANLKGGLIKCIGFCSIVDGSLLSTEPAFTFQIGHLQAASYRSYLI